MSNNENADTDTDAITTPSGQDGYDNPTPISPPTQQQTQDEMAASFYAAYQTVLREWLRNRETEEEEDLELSEMLQDDNNNGEVENENEDNLSLEESQEGDEQDSETSSSFLSDDVDDGDFDYRTIRQLFPHRGPNNITGTGLEMPDVLTAKICIHAVNTLGIIRRYLPDEEDSYKSCQYMPRRVQPIAFTNMMNKNCPLDDLNPDEFDCRTKLIVLVKDKPCKFWGSHWTTLLLEALNEQNITAMCFTLRAQPCVHHLNTMLDALGTSVQNLLHEQMEKRMGGSSSTADGDATTSNPDKRVNERTEVEKFIAMTILYKLFRFWSVPILIIDYAPKRVLNYKSILSFARRNNIKIMTFGDSNKVIGTDISATNAKKICQSKADQICKAVIGIYDQEFQVKLQSGHYSMQSASCVKNLKEICDQGVKDGNISEDKIPPTPPTDQDILAINNNVIISSTFNDWNEWLECEQPYYDGKDEIRQKTKAQDNLNKTESEQRVPPSPSPSTQAAFDSLQNREYEFVENESLPTFHQLLHGDIEMPGLVKTSKTERRSIFKVDSTSNSSCTETASSDDSTDSEDDAGQNSWGGSRRKDVANSFVPNPTKKERPFVRFAKRKLELEQLKESLNNYNCPNHDGLMQSSNININPNSNNLDEDEEGIDENENNNNDEESNPNSKKLTSKELEEIKELQSETVKNLELRRLRKYFQKMKRDCKLMLQCREPDSYKHFNLVDDFNEGKSCCLEIKEDEMELYKKDIHDVLSPYDIVYLKRDFSEHHAQYKVNLLTTTMQEATSNFIDTVIQVCCGSRLLPGPKMHRKTIKTLIFINDNSDALELLTGALWFAGKTAVASCQRKYYDQNKYFESCLTACQSYAGKEVKGEELYMTWITIGLNQVLKQDDIKFVIVDFPRPGKALNKVFKALLEKFQAEKAIRNIETLYVSKCPWRGDNLSTVENVLNQLEHRMDPVDRMIFRKSRKMYLDFHLCSNYELEVKEDLTRDSNWGLPPAELMTPELWESIRLHEIQTCCKTLSNTKPSLTGDDDDDDEIMIDAGALAMEYMNMNNNEAIQQQQQEMEEFGDAINENASEASGDHEYNEDDEDAGETSQDDDGEEDALQLLQDTERLRRQLDTLEQLGSSQQVLSPQIQQLYQDWVLSGVPVMDIRTILRTAEEQGIFDVIQNNPVQVVEEITPDDASENTSLPVFESQQNVEIENVEVIVEAHNSTQIENEVIPKVGLISVNVESPLCPKEEEKEEELMEEVVEQVCLDEEEVKVETNADESNNNALTLTEALTETEPTPAAPEELSTTLNEVTSYLLQYADDNTPEYEVDDEDATSECGDELLPSETFMPNDDTTFEEIVVDSEYDDMNANIETLNISDIVDEICSKIIEKSEEESKALEEQEEEEEEVKFEETENEVQEMKIGENEIQERKIGESGNEILEPKEPDLQFESENNESDSSASQDDDEEDKINVEETSETSSESEEESKSDASEFDGINEFDGRRNPVPPPEEVDDDQEEPRVTKFQTMENKTNKDDDDYYDPENYIPSTDSDDEFVEKISTINYIIDPPAENNNVLFVQDDDLEDDEDEEEEDKNRNWILPEKQDKVFTPPKNIVELISQMSHSNVLEKDESVKGAVVESETESSDDSESDVKFQNLIASNHTTIPPTPLTEATSTLTSDDSEDTEDDDDDEEESERKDLTKAINPIAEDEEEKEDEHFTRVTPEWLENAILSCDTSAKQQKSVKFYPTSRVGPECHPIVQSEKNTKLAMRKLPRHSFTLGKSSLLELGTILITPFRIILNFFRKK